MKDWPGEGFFIARNIIDRDLALEIRGVLKNRILEFTEAPEGKQLDPAGVEGDDIGARLSRARKLNCFGLEAPLIWHSLHAGVMAEMAREYLGDDLLVKFAACFLKPPKTGSETPWHQDNGLWQDGETHCFNFWMAIDPATKENGCLQMIPKSHRGPIVEHVIYSDGLHAELPREHMLEVLEKTEPVHIEMEPGDAVCWHSSLYHYSPPNRSDNARMAVAGVYTNLEYARISKRWQTFYWALRGGKHLHAWPPEKLVIGDGRVKPVLAGG